MQSLTTKDTTKQQLITEVNVRPSTDGRYNSSSAGSTADLRALFQERLFTMRKACQDNIQEVPQDVEKPDFQFNIAPKQKLIMCKTAKHGTTTWSQYFLQIITDG